MVFIGSIVGSIGSGFDSAYSASKAAVEALAKSLAVEESRHGVRLNVLQPGNVLTEQRQRSVAEATEPALLDGFLDRMCWQNRSIDPMEIARAAVMLLCDELPSLTGAVIPITGGLELGPSPKISFEEWIDLAPRN